MTAKTPGDYIEDFNRQQYLGASLKMYSEKKSRTKFKYLCMNVPPAPQGFQNGLRWHKFFYEDREIMAPFSEDVMLGVLPLLAEADMSADDMARVFLITRPVLDKLVDTYRDTGR